MKAQPIEDIGLFKMSGEFDQETEIVPAGQPVVGKCIQRGEKLNSGLTKLHYGDEEVGCLAGARQNPYKEYRRRDMQIQLVELFAGHFIFTKEA